MSCYIYADYFGLYLPGQLQGMLDGGGPIGPTSQGTLVAVTILVAVPAVMIFASLVMRPRLNRWVNIVFAVSLAIIEIMTLPGAWAFYWLMTSIEVILQVLIIGYAWNWPKRTTA